ncbi:MAG TPA: hypothetical protein VGU43_04420 [Thermoplasmata archaeon]|nr:hypothetical protein [Thermoplasmata archaeon]
MDANELARRLTEFSQVAGEVLRDVKDVTEQQTKHWIISPFLVALGWDPHDKKQVYLDFPAGSTGEHADYALLDPAGKARIILDVHRPTENGSDPDEAAKLARAVSAPLALITNGQEFSLWYVAEGDSPTPLLALSLRDLADNAESLLGLTADYRGSETGVQQLRRYAIRQAVLQLLEDNAERTFDAITAWVRAQVSPNGQLDDVSEQALREATLLWLTDEHLLLPGFAGGRDAPKASELRVTHMRDWEQFPRGPPGTFVYRFDSGKTLDVRQTPKEVREALRLQGLRTGTATAFGGFYSALRQKAGLPSN